uniref:WW domain-containing protein n=1 Tax=Tetradesmus obliquus TaxID=3088 RepID=A0A383VRH9_TETOB|eukprot:jgi/Sobl393_1/16389/SZX67771.1
MQVQQMGLYLGIKQDEDPYIWQVAQMALSAPLAPGWFADRAAAAAILLPPAGAADEAVQQMGLYLGIKQDEDPYIWQVAQMALSAPLPPGWAETVMETDGQPTVMFENAKTGAVQQDHPLDNYFRELMRRRRKELLRKKKAALKTLQVGKVYKI